MMQTHCIHSISVNRLNILGRIYFFNTFFVTRFSIHTQSVLQQFNLALMKPTNKSVRFICQLIDLLHLLHRFIVCHRQHHLYAQFLFKNFVLRLVRHIHSFNFLLMGRGHGRRHTISPSKQRDGGQQCFYIFLSGIRLSSQSRFRPLLHAFILASKYAIIAVLLLPLYFRLEATS